MSAPEERTALPQPASLYAYALRLQRAEPYDRLPKGGYSLPDPRPPSPERRTRPGRDWRESEEAARQALEPLLTDADTARAAEEADRRLREAGVNSRHIFSAIDKMTLHHEGRARALGRHLTRTGTTAYAVGTGIALLTRLGEPEDVPYLRTLGLLRGFTRPAIRALTALDAPTAALLWLGRYTRGRELRPLIDALAVRDDGAARAWLLDAPLEPGCVDSAIARRIAEASRLADVLDDEQVTPAILAQAGRLLARMTSPLSYESEIRSYRDAVRVYDAVVARGSMLTPSLDLYATLLTLALDLRSGPSVLLDWRAGQREALLEALDALLATPGWAAVLAAREPADPAERHRLQWARRTARQPFAAAPASFPLRIEVVVRDPADPDVVETRFLLDGRPLVPEAFGRGPGHSPENLLDSGSLRATADGNEVQLAEAYCTEGCCGALSVTIRRDGDEVVWDGWRGTSEGMVLPAYRFDAVGYDAEIARAETDRAWSWPARTTARMVSEGLRGHPDLLSRWNLRGGWAHTDFSAPETVVLWFTFRPEGDGPWLQFSLRLPDDGTPPEAWASAALRRLAEEDPKGYAKVCGGSREYAEALGFAWREG
ncbi:hypothetical protein [Streptomyces sp. NPDC019890]|uniref:hypothetical protein n=1 Tax=Streptomyces sp. NPDC019890 TaxID=3365064 RepID=UPI00384E03DF